MRFDGEDVGRCSQAGRADVLRSPQLQVVFQDPYASLNPRMRVGEIVAEPLAHAHAVTARRWKRASASCWSWSAWAGQGARYSRTSSAADSASGSAIARALATEPG